MIPVWSSILSLRPAIPSNSKDTSFWEHPPKGSTLLLTPVFRDFGIKKEAPGGSFIKIRDHLDEGSSPLRLEHASNEARPKPSSSAHLRENDKDLKKPSKATTTSRASDRLWQDTRCSDVRPGRNLQDMQECDGITSFPRCSEEEIRVSLWEAGHQHTQPMSSLSFLVHLKRKEVQNPKDEPHPLRIGRLEPNHRLQCEQEFSLSPSTAAPCHNTYVSWQVHHDN